MVANNTTPPLPRKLRFFVTVTWKKYSWRYAVDVKARRVDGEVINLVDYIDPRQPDKRCYVGRFDPTQADTRKAILLGTQSAFQPDEYEYRAAAWALQRLSWGAEPSTLPEGVSIDVALAPGLTTDDINVMLDMMRSSRPRGTAQ